MAGPRLLSKFTFLLFRTRRPLGVKFGGSGISAILVADEPPCLTVPAALPPAAHVGGYSNCNDQCNSNGTYSVQCGTSCLHLP